MVIFTYFFNAYRINVASMSVIEMGIQVFFGVKRFAAKAAGPLRGSVLMLCLLLRSKDISTLVKRTFQWQFYLILLQYWHPSLKSRRSSERCARISPRYFYKIIVDIIF